MSFLQWLIDIDIWLFHLVNQSPHPAFLNHLFLFFSFYPLIFWSVICLFIIWWEQKKDQRFFLKFILALGVAGIVVSGVVKPLVQRPRPDLQLGEQVIVISEKPALLFWNNDFAFPSGHAAIAFAGAYILGKEITSKRKSRPYWVILFYLIATLTAFSRIYLGKHYPLDVTMGALIGMITAAYTWKVIGKMVSK